jgi:hypothetical protein
MKHNSNTTASLEPSTHAADFAQRLNVNEARLTSELRPHDVVFLYSSGAASLPFVADLMLAVNGKERSLAEYNLLFGQVCLRTIKTTPLDNGYVVIETAAI